MDDLTSIGRWTVEGEVPRVYVGYECDDTWTPLGAVFSIREDAERVADALNAAESSATRTEVCGTCANSGWVGARVAPKPCPDCDLPTPTAEDLASSSSPVVDREPAEPEDEFDYCIRCGGSGTVRSNPWTRSWKECPECHGTGDPEPSVPPVPQPEPDQHRAPIIGDDSGRHGHRRWVYVPDDWEGWVLVRRADNENPRGTG